MRLQDHEQAFDAWQKDEKRYWGFMSTLGGMLAVTATLSVAYSCVSEAPAQAQKIALDCRECHSRKLAMTEYFRKAGSKTPEAMAEAVLHPAIKSPRLLAAIAVKENTPYTVRKGGYRKAHAGAWQVNPKHWGKVPKDITGQALQADRILNELTQEMPITKAISTYGGDSTSKYQRAILAELVRVP